LGVSTDDATSSETVDWSLEDFSHDVSWDSFLVAFSFNDPVGKVLGLVKLLHEMHLVAIGSIAELLELDFLIELLHEMHLVAIGSIAELLEEMHLVAVGSIAKFLEEFLLVAIRSIAEFLKTT